MKHSFTSTDDLLQKLSKELARKRVLVVDRHPNARTSLRMMLSTLGVPVVHGAGNTAEVMRQVKAHHFDIILSDYILDDGRDGQQLLAELRQRKLVTLSTVFIIITGERAYRSVVSVAELAPDDYLIKPFTADQLQARLVRAVHKKQFFSELFENLDNGAFADALAECETLLFRDGGFVFDTLRFKGEILNALGRHDEAQAVYQQVLANRMVPWARMGLAIALRGQDQLADAEALGESIVDDFPEFLAAYDFVAGVREEMGKLAEAQEVLQQAAVISPNNASRQRLVGDVAARNNDLEAAEKAYSKVLERNRGSSLRTIDDYANLSRVMLDRGHASGAKAVTQELRRDWRGSKEAELAAFVMESLCAEKEGETAKAKLALTKALELRSSLGADAAGGSGLSQKLSIDLAHACMAGGDEETAQEILRKVAAENNEDRSMMAQIEGVFAKTGNQEAGQALLAAVNKEIIELNNRGVLAARSGDVEGAVRMLIEAADRVPNLQFLINAAKAIFTLLERKGWDAVLADKGQHYLQQAQAKDPQNAKLLSARELCQRVARKFGITLQAQAAARNETART